MNKKDSIIAVGAHISGTLPIERVKKLLRMQIEECAVHAQRCARDKGMANKEYDEWIKSTQVIDFMQ